MRYSVLKLVLLTIGLWPLLGCNLGHYATRVTDTFQFRQDLHQQQMAVREAELDRERTELERLRRAELNEIRRQTAEMVPELKTTLETQISQKIKNLRLVPDYAHMAKTAEQFAKLEQENEKIYQEQLTKWIENQSEIQRSEAQFASWRPFCQMHGGHGCLCHPEPDCAKPNPKRAPLRAPLKSVPPKMPVRYKMEFEIEQDVESQSITEALPGRAPLKERCLPEKGKSCGKHDCEQCHPFRHRHLGGYGTQAGDSGQTSTVPAPPQPPIPVIYDETVYRAELPAVRAASGVAVSGFKVQ